MAKPLLALAVAPWHVLGVRFLDRVGKGARESPRDALISLSTERARLGRAFGFHRGMDTLGAALGPLAAFAILPLINQNYRLLFLLSFIASFFAVLILVFFVREVRAPVGGSEPARERPVITDVRPNLFTAVPRADRNSFLSRLGAPFFLFLAIAVIASLGRASEAFLILRAREVGIAVIFIPLLYVAFSITYALLSTPLGVLADRVGKRNTFIAGLLVFSAAYFGCAFADSSRMVWALCGVYGLYAALTDGVGRAIVAGLVVPDLQATAFGFYNAFTGVALLPASVVFGYLNQHWGSRTAFSYGATLTLMAVVAFLVLRRIFDRRVNLTERDGREYSEIRP